MPAPQELLIATRNGGKLREIARLLSGLPLNLRVLADFPRVGDVEETGQTFVENATLKALYYSGRTRLLTLADDSGLEVDALGGAPGVRSARYAGPEASDAERISKLLNALEVTGDAERRARFVCALSLVRPGGVELGPFIGRCEGHIAREPRGAGGFGYDPVFIPRGYAETFGELSAEIKNLISHRARALRSARSFFEEHFRLP